MTSGGDLPPSWPQPPIPAHLLRRRRPSSFLTPPLIVIISIPAALALSFFAIPRVFSMPNQLWKGTVGFGRGWDSLNIALVLFAILCGIFAPRRGDEDAAKEASCAGDGANTRSPPMAEKAIEMTAQQWFQSIDSRIYELPEERVPVAGIGRVGRNGGPYPDLMQESWRATGEGRFRSLDSLVVEGYYRRLDQPASVQLRRWQSAIDESEIKEIPVDTFVRGSRSPPSEVLPEQAKLRPPPNLPPIATQKKRSTYDYETVGETATTPPPPPPPLPPPPPPPRREQSPVRVERRKSSATEEIKVIIASILSANKRKKRRLKARTIEGSVSVHHSVDETPDRRIPPPPPPPPSQPQSFLSIFKKTSKTWRIHSASAQPPHPPPSPAEQGWRSTAKPPLPKKPKKNREDIGTRRRTRIPAAPPPPPPPPSTFSPSRRRRTRESGIAEAEGDASGTGKKRATSSSDGDGAKESGHLDGEENVKGGPGPALFCESPDVNVKADTFIARLKDGWRIERMNSIREKHGLGPGPS